MFQKLVRKLIERKIRKSKNYRDIPNRENTNTYMRRHYLFFDDRKNRNEKFNDTPFNVMIHEIRESDRDADLHDHPWSYFTFIVSGGYIEHLKGGDVKERKPGYFTLRKPRSFHKLELYKDNDGKEIQCTTLFVRGKRVKEWGFMVKNTFVIWNDYLSKTNRV